MALPDSFWETIFAKHEIQVRVVLMRPEIILVLIFV